MMKKLFNWILDKWLAGFLTASIFFAGKIFYDLPSHEKKSFFDLSWVKSVLTYPISLWQVLIICAFLLLVIIYKRPKRVDQTSPNDSITGLEYTEDVFGANKWLWTWKNKWSSIQNSILISDAQPNCPECYYTMTLGGYHNNLATCSNCKIEGKKSQYGILQNPDDIIKIIINRMNSGDWIHAKQRIKDYKIKR